MKITKAMAQGLLDLNRPAAISHVELNETPEQPDSIGITIRDVAGQMMAVGHMDLDGKVSWL
jgi:hypothetical protein